MITLPEGLADLSKELGESTTNTGTRRIQHYNDAVQDFANDKKWPFLTKENTSLTTGDGSSAIDISGITDIRMPGGIMEITVTGYSDPFLPVPWKDRHVESTKNRFYITPDEQSLKFTKELNASAALDIWYWYIPERITDTASVSSFPIPSRYRKAVGTLAAAYVQYSRYLDGPGSRLINFYERLLERVETNQAETNQGTPKRIQNPMSYMGRLRDYRRRR